MLLLALSLTWMGCVPAFALTAADLAGVYKGTSVATLANGASVTASVTITLKPKGNIKTVATVNGQTTTSKGKYVFVSDDVLLGNFPSGEFTAIVVPDGDALTLTLLVKTADGSIVSERTTLSLVQKL